MSNFLSFYFAFLILNITHDMQHVFVSEIMKINLNQNICKIVIFLYVKGNFPNKGQFNSIIFVNN